MRKIFGFKSITTLLYGLLMLLPMFSILSRVIYVQSNQNAFESYYGETINQELYESISYNELVEDNVYYFNNNILTNTYEATPQTTFWISNIILITPLTIDLSNATNMKFYVNSNGIPRLYFYNGDNAIGSPIDLNNSSINFSFKFLGSTNISSNTSLLNDVDFSYVTYNSYSFLDNAFDYSLKTFVDENNYGFNFFSWFGDMFLEQSGKNMIYLNFINWYLNYGLLISVAYIFFLILLWFINLSRRILDRLMNFDGGGY